MSPGEDTRSKRGQSSALTLAVHSGYTPVAQQNDVASTLSSCFWLLSLHKLPRFTAGSTGVDSTSPAQVHAHTQTSGTVVRYPKLQIWS